MRHFRKPEAHHLMRLFENNYNQTTDSLLGGSMGSSNSPLSQSPNLLPSGMGPSQSPGVTLSQPAASLTVPSPVIDLDSCAFLSARPLRPLSPASKPPSPASALMIAPNSKELPSTKNDTQHPHPPKGDISQSGMPNLTNQHTVNSAAINYSTAVVASVNEPPVNVNRLTPSMISDRQTSAGTPPQLAHGAKLSPRSQSGVLEGMVVKSHPMLRARSHSDQRVPSEQVGNTGLLKVDGHHYGQHHQYNSSNNNVRSLHRTAASTSQTNIEENALKPGNISIPLARRVRSATTLRQTEEDSVPLKALIANKQHQLYQQASADGSLTSNAEDRRNLTESHHDHRRSNSADSMLKGTSNVKRSNHIHVPPLSGVVSAKDPERRLHDERQVTPLANSPGSATAGTANTIQPLKLDGLKTPKELHPALNQALGELSQWLDRLDGIFSSLEPLSHS
ncbi:hypothetical protein BX666DRAFT_1171820 [Dichotomocladium elegans]|nr:hypothetical protein BX666DRAFT_1171820 [Dichotomocladium elegans]